MKKENIAGLLLDLCYNGGGSMQKAADLPGIFFAAGPVAQIKSRDGKVHTLRDINRGSIYDGPLLFLFPLAVFILMLSAFRSGYSLVKIPVLT